MTKLGYDFREIFEEYNRELMKERAHFDDRHPEQNRPVTPEERIEANTMALLKVIAKNNEQITKSLHRLLNLHP